MMTSSYITKTSLAELVDALIKTGTQVVAPQPAERNGVRQLEYRTITSFSQAVLGSPLPKRSLKEFFLPPTEPLFRWKETKAGVDIQEVPTTPAPRVILGSYTCDAAAVDAVDKVMNWDYRDELWFGRRQATTVISLACPGGDKSCFCTTVGLAPDAAKGSDLMLVPQDDGYLVEVHTEKGKTFVEANKARFGAPRPDSTQAYRQKALASVEGNLEADTTAVKQWVDAHFEHGFWAKVALNCHGCGACAALCPTCHCFDIVDEPDGLGMGVRRRNWDTCQTAKFTLHGSGHNPRPLQTNRMRQRITHKFSIYPQRFSELLCSGCGRCARVCGGGMNLPEVLSSLTALARAEKNTGGVA